MAEKSNVITIGGKGLALTSASVYAIANRLAQVRIDSSALDKLASSNSKQAPPPADQRFSLPTDLSDEQSRAALVVSINKLIISGAAGVTADLLDKIVDLLNGSDEVREIEVNGVELGVLEKSDISVQGILAVTHYEASSLSAIVDFVAGLSCEALRAKVTALNVVDSGDGFSYKDETAVGSDLKVLLNGSKFVGKEVIESVCEIPSLHASLREVVRLVHSKARIELNSGTKVGRGKALAAAVLPLTELLMDIGENSLSRSSLIVGSLEETDAARKGFEVECPASLISISECVSRQNANKDCVKCFSGIHQLLKSVSCIVRWEAILAFVSLERELRNEGNVSADNKSNKKPKVALGKGNAVILQYIKDQVQSVETNVVDGINSILNPQRLGFDVFVKKIKETVESNESRRLPKLPKGTRDFAKEQMAIRRKAFAIITEVFQRHGATELDTPAFELKETLMGKYGEDSKLVYDLADQGGELCSLRYDLTVPFARYVAMNGLTSFKRYQIAKVYRRDNPSKGRYREFYQCDLDIAGQYELMGPDFEIVKILTELLDELDIGDYEVKLNHRKLLDGMMEICGVPPQKFRTICSSIDKLDKQSFEQIKKEMVEDKGLSVETAEKIGEYVKQRGSPLELLYKLKQDGSKLLENQGSAVALNELEILFRALEKSKCVGKVVFDLSLARGLDYYTGVIFEAVFKGSTQVGSIAAGGRYDNLIGMFGTKQVPAIGVSLGIERVFAIMEEVQKERSQAIRATETQVLVSIVGDDLDQAAELVNDLWSAKMKAEYLVNKRISKHFDRQKDSRIPWMVIVEKKQIEEGTVRIKNIATGQENSVPRTRFVEELQQLMNVAAAAQD